MKRLLIVMLVSVALLAACGEVTPTPTESPLPSPLITPTTENRAPGADFEKPKSEQPMEENGIMDNVLQALLDFCMSAALPTIAGACALDIFVGIGAALRSGKFDWRKIGNFYQTQVLSLVVPYIGALAVIALVPDLVDFLPVAVAPAGLFAGIMAKLGGSILANAQVLSAGGAE